MKRIENEPNPRQEKSFLRALLVFLAMARG